MPDPTPRRLAPEELQAIAARYPRPIAGWDFNGNPFPDTPAEWHTSMNVLLGHVAATDAEVERWTREIATMMCGGLGIEPLSTNPAHWVMAIRDRNERVAAMEAELAALRGQAAGMVSREVAERAVCYAAEYGRRMARSESLDDVRREEVADKYLNDPVFHRLCRASFARAAVEAERAQPPTEKH